MQSPQVESTATRNEDSPRERLSALPKGIHILADFFDIQRGEREMVEAAALREFCQEQVHAAGLTEVGEHFYQFDDAGVTGVVLLAESHVAIHTWPEKNYLTLDVFVCNVTEDNSHKARHLYESFVKLFQPQQVNHKEVERE